MMYTGTLSQSPKVQYCLYMNDAERRNYILLVGMKASVNICSWVYSCTHMDMDFRTT